MVSVSLNGYDPSTMTVVVLPGRHELLRFILRPALKEIARVQTKESSLYGRKHCGHFYR